ncbi:hypothetical protein DL93DRAFT_513037 [Clavulina sp. PMI_390]|nr:hypothetical protein DL93DRAFT_513037 [Clavulina sp. PMI_390]
MTTPPPPNCVLVDTLDALSAALVDIVRAQRVSANPAEPLLYVDIEGNDLCREGTVSLVQIHLPSIRKTLVIDITILGAAAFSHSIPLPREFESYASPSSPFSNDAPVSLKTILESPWILKCFFDVRNDADALYNIYRISMNSVVDLQILEVATRRGKKRLLNGLARAIRTDGGLDEVTLTQWLDVKMRGKALFGARDPVPPPSSPLSPRSPASPSSPLPSTTTLRNPAYYPMPLTPPSSPETARSTTSSSAGSPVKEQSPNFAIFDVRPLSPELLEYSVNDVIHLPRLWAIYDAKLDSKWRVKTENEAVWRLQLAKQDVYYGKNGNMALSPF